MRYLISVSGKPVNVILADAASVADTMAALSGGTARLLADDEVVGFQSDYVANQQPLSIVEFLRRFTQQERIAINAAAKTTPEIYDYQYLLEHSINGVLLSDPDVMAGVNALEAFGLIASGRANEILLS